MHGSESSASGADGKATSAKVLVQDGTTGDKYNVPLAQLFFQLSSQSALNFEHVFPDTKGEVNDDRLPALFNFNFFCSCDVDVAKIILYVTSWGYFDIKQGFC